MSEKEISFNHMVDHGKLLGYTEIVYISSAKERLVFEEWQELDFKTLSGEGHFLLLEG